ncbi:MAG: glycosyltransferase family A protein [Ignavibacteria bacterium]|nr:glycosyltransferase family A protein [Ignavibacteria bacterium]
MDGLTVIIAHYAPGGNTEKYRSLLKKTIDSIRNQNVDFSVEIILCDDGSTWSKEINRNENISELDKLSIQNCESLNDLNIDKYLGLPDCDKYRGVVLKQRAFEIAKHDKIVVLDDDHPFIKKKSLKKFYDYLDDYEYVRGRIISPVGLPQTFFTKNAQGTTYALRKSLFNEFGGFGKYLYENGQGEDNDILWRIFSKLKEKYGTEKRACYAGEIITKDLATNRWADRAIIANLADLKIAKIVANKNNPKFVQRYERFYNEYGVDASNNSSRKKNIWMKIPSITSLFSEIKYSWIYLFVRTKLTIEKAHANNQNIIIYTFKKFFTKNSLIE